VTAVTRSRGYARLVEACAKPGCPVCRCLHDDVVRYLATLLYEHVTDPDMRASLRAARGFCRWHVETLTDLPDSALGSAIIAADVLGREIARAEQTLAAVRRTRPRVAWRDLLRRRRDGRRGEARTRATCPACAMARESERRHLDTMLESVGDARFDRALDGSDGPCVTHLERLVESRAPDAAVLKVLAQTVDCWRRLRDTAQRFAEKHDYRNRVPFTEAEARSWRQALELLAGPLGDAGEPSDRRRGRTRRA